MYAYTIRHVWRSGVPLIATLPCPTDYMSKSMGASACYHPDYTAPQFLTSHAPRTAYSTGYGSSSLHPTLRTDTAQVMRTPHTVPILRSSACVSPYSQSLSRNPSYDKDTLKSTFPIESAVQGLDSVDRYALLDLSHTILYAT